MLGLRGEARMSSTDILETLRAEQARSEARVRAVIAEAGTPEDLARFDASMEHVHSGRSELESLWHSITPAQRTLVLLVGEGRRLVRCAWSRHRYGAVGEPHAVRDCASARTVEALIRHRLLAPAGTTDDPGQVVVATERLSALLAYRRSRN